MAPKLKSQEESDRPSHLVQTHVTEEARRAIQKLADLEADGSVGAYVRRLLMRELWAQRKALKMPILPPPRDGEEVTKQVRINLAPRFRKEMLESIEILSELEGQSHASWLKGVIVRELHRKRHILAAAKKTQAG